MRLILTCSSHEFVTYPVMFPAALSMALMSAVVLLLGEVGSKPQFARIVLAFTDALITF